MLAALLLISNMASAQVVCTPGDAKEKNVAVCGDERVPTYTTSTQKVQAVNLVFENTDRGFNKIVEVKNPGLTLAQISAGSLNSSAAVKKEIEKVKKEWSAKEVRVTVGNFTFDKKAPLFAAADMKQKAVVAKLATKVQRNVASVAPVAGGVRGAKEEKTK